MCVLFFSQIILKTTDLKILDYETVLPPSQDKIMSKLRNQL